MNGYLALTEAAVQAIEIHPPLRFSWFGKFPPPLPARTAKGLQVQDGVARDYLLVTLGDHLYSHFYCKGFAAPLRWESGASPTRGAEGWLASRLSEANGGQGSWEPGWQIVALAGTEIVARRDGLTLRVRSDDCRTLSGDTPTPSAMASIRLPSALPQLSPGFYLIAGERAFEADEWQRLIRLYWHLTAAGATCVVHAVTQHLNQIGLPFRLKVVNDVDRTERCDSVVLYLRQDDYPALETFLQRLHGEVRGHLRPGTPVYTKHLALGLGLAEDPGAGLSFGLERSRTLADGLLAAHDAGCGSVADRLRVVKQRFVNAGVDIDRPYLRPASQDVYPFLEAPLAVPSRPGQRINRPSDEAEPPLVTAQAIGRRLCETALWHHERCTWIGPAGKDPSGLSLGALGPDLYGGTSGVAWFLADLAAITGDRTVRETALGAIRHALAHADAIVPSFRIGLYSGWLGVARAAAHAGRTLGDAELLDHARQLLARDELDSADPPVVDLMAGSAGGIIGLLALRDMLGDPDAALIERAERLGNDLLRRAVRSDAGASWRTINGVKEYHLTGLSHGTAGIALALLELFEATQDRRYRETADLAFAYERHWFDAEVGNWPDLRESPARRSHPRHALAFSTYWCHGAPGIGLARLRAYRILRDPRLRLDAAIALGTTRRMIEESLPAGSVNFSLCHGLAGNAEVLLLGARLLPEICPGASEIAAEVGATGARRHRGTEHDWQYGAPGGTSPSLMLGLAGIGHFYLRLHNPSLPSVLLPRGQTAASAQS